MSFYRKLPVVANNHKYDSDHDISTAELKLLSKIKINLERHALVGLLKQDTVVV